MNLIVEIPDVDANGRLESYALRGGWLQRG